MLPPYVGDNLNNKEDIEGNMMGSWLQNSPEPEDTNLSDGEGRGLWKIERRG